MMYMRSKSTKSWRSLFLRYFDFNESGTINWWEYLIPILFILVMEVLAELIAAWVAGLI